MSILLHHHGRAADAVRAEEQLAVPATNAQHRHRQVVCGAEAAAELSAMNQSRNVLSLPRRSFNVQGGGDDISAMKVHNGGTEHPRATYEPFKAAIQPTELVGRKA